MPQHAGASGNAVENGPVHVPVMADEVIALLAPAPGQVVLDCTVGRGGHAAAIMPRLSPGGRYIGLDVDPANIEHLRAARPRPPVRLDLARRNFSEAREALDELEVPAVDGLLADLGFASSQMADPQRGLSFSRDDPLDMRLDPALPTTAADLVRRLSERELTDLLRAYGEERLARRIAGKIVAERSRSPITTTGRLAALCARAYGPRRRRTRIDPATRTFQALRIAVNDELGHLRKLLGQLEVLIRPGGRALILSFHSLEDRLVKRAFRELADAGRATLLTRKPLRPSARERAANPRSRSARCRAIELRRVLPG